MSARVGTGLVIMQPYTPGSDPTERPTIEYVAGKWEFTPGVTLTDIIGPTGARVRQIPSMVQPQIAIETMSAPLAVERSRLHGTKTVGAAAAAVDLRYLSSFRVQLGMIGDGLLPRADLITALGALMPAADAPPGVYEIRVTAPATIVLRRVWPTAVVVTDTDVLSAALDAADWLVAAPMAGDGGSIFFSIEPATDGSYEVDLFNPEVEFVRITCMTEFTLGNSFLQVVCDPCVAVEPTIASERATVNNLATTYNVLFGEARVTQQQFARALPEVPGLA